MALLAAIGVAAPHFPIVLKSAADWQIPKSGPGGWRATKIGDDRWHWRAPLLEQPRSSGQRDREFAESVRAVSAETAAAAEQQQQQQQQQGAEKQQPNGAERTLAATVTTGTWPKKEILEADQRIKIVEQEESWSEKLGRHHRASHQASAY